VRTFYGQEARGFFRCGHPHFLVQKIGFFEIYGVSARMKGEGLSQCRHLRTSREGESIFRDSVRTSIIVGL